MQCDNWFIIDGKVNTESVLCQLDLTRPTFDYSHLGGFMTKPYENIIMLQML